MVGLPALWFTRKDEEQSAAVFVVQQQTLIRYEFGFKYCGSEDLPKAL